MRSVGGLSLVVMLAAGACGGGARPPETPTPVRDGKPTEARCREVVTRLGTVLPADFPDVESDTTDCLELPANVVECLAAVNTEADLDACVRTFCKENPKACPRVEASWTPRPTRADCERAFDRLTTLRATPSGLGEPDRTAFVDDCHTQAHRRDVDCILAAADLNGIDRCAKDAPRAN